MTELTHPEIYPLLDPLPADQQALLQIIGNAVLATGTWPIYQYVEPNSTSSTTTSTWSSAGSRPWPTGTHPRAGTGPARSRSP